MAYPATDVASLREELCGAARACGSEVKLRRALAALKETQLPCPGAGGPEVAPSAACPASSPRGILESLGHGLHKAKEIFGSWHLLNWTHHDEAEAFVDPDVKKVLKSLREGSGVFGMDIGGTLAKAAQLLSPGEGHLSPATFGKTGTFHQELSFQLTINEVPHDVHFLSGATFYLELVLKKLRDSIDDDEASERMGNRRIVTAGGGAHRLAQLFMESLTVEVVPFKEMESLVSGLTFLHKHGPEDEVFQITPDGTKQFVKWPSPLYPCIIVNIGSGVSVLRLDGGEDGAFPFFTRLGGTATGGAAFLGLVRLLTSAKTFADCLALAQKGDATKVNKLVSDIYGQDGCSNLGLAPGLTAAHFAKVTMKDFDHPDYQEADIAAAVLTMVVSASTVIARAFSRSVASATSSEPEKPTHIEEEPGVRQRTASGSSVELANRQVAQLMGAAPYPGQRKTPVFFVGGFLADNRRAWEIISRSFRNLDCGPALFLRHADFLGALGCLAATIDETVASPRGQ